MHKLICLLLSALLIFTCSATLMGNEWANYYFPDTLGNYWVYEDENGDELTRYAVEPEEVDGETYRAFNYEPALEDWADYLYHAAPYYYLVGDEWVAALAGEYVKNAFTARITEELETLRAMGEQEMAQQSELPGVHISLRYDVSVEAPDYFYLLPTPATFDEEWEAMQINIEITLGVDVEGDPSVFHEETPDLKLYFTIVETGNVTETETVETDAGTFEDCLKIEYRTKTTVTASEPMEGGPPPVPGESFTTIWLAPNVGIVKFAQEAQAVVLTMIGPVEIQAPVTAVTERSLELTQYEIKPTEAGETSSPE